MLSPTMVYCWIVLLDMLKILSLSFLFAGMILPRWSPAGNMDSCGALFKHRMKAPSLFGLYPKVERKNVLHTNLKPPPDSGNRRNRYVKVFLRLEL